MHIRSYEETWPHAAKLNQALVPPYDSWLVRMGINLVQLIKSKVLGWFH